jgi:hypothetical protein
VLTAPRGSEWEPRAIFLDVIETLRQGDLTPLAAPALALSPLRPEGWTRPRLHRIGPA